MMYLTILGWVLLAVSCLYGFDGQHISASITLTNSILVMMWADMKNYLKGRE